MSFTVVSATQITAIVPAGVGTVQVTVVTPGGVSAGRPYTYLPVPTLTALTPNQGPITGGNTVTLTGTGFTRVTTVSFGGILASSFTVVSDTQVTAIAPAGGLGSVGVTVTSPGGTSNGILYSYVAAPTLGAVTPNAGPATGGNTVILTGTDLTGASVVSFGGVAAVSFTVVSATQITVIAPAGTGTVQVTITTPGGTTAGRPYTYVPAPILTGRSPSVGRAAGGNIVTLTGTNLTGTTAVSFGTTAATSFTVVSDTQVRATAPAGTGVVAITVTTPGGGSNPLTYTYVSITSINPAQGPTSGGTTVTITGAGFTGATGVSFNSARPTFTVDSDTQITVTTLPTSAGTVQVSVRTPNGDSNSVPFTFVAAPILFLLIPGTGSAAGGDSVVLTGTHFTGATTVSFGGTPATSFTVDSDTQITAVASARAGNITISVRVITAGGTSNPLLYSYRPQLDSSSPNSGPPGTSVALGGVGFTGATGVFFGGVTVPSFTVVSDSQITTTSPLHVPGTVDVTVINAVGSSDGVPYTYP
ncbi:beta strand repeat-containing protein [Nocardia arizonensis]|uniref:beta strand repeat-containing protein n=1 Tax=Nocardia arizonensis TaxID=1141647 RepID=UPI000A7F05D4|nr:IPT/TIG domain-containing protein [Nocardia arizonensis]